jgi:hypothetical protein
MNYQYPFHAISNVDCFGVDYYKQGSLPRLEDDFATIQEATAYLSANGGGSILQLVAGEYRRVQNVDPGEDGDALALTA